MSLLVQNIEFTSDSQKRLGYFLKIEELQLATFLVLCNNFKPDVFFDVGANVGFYTIVIKKYFSDLHCHAFEPSGETYVNLKQNVSFNCLKNVMTYNYALSDTDGESKFIIFGACSGMNSIAETSIHNANSAIETVNIIVKTLDSLFKYVGRRLIFKIDTEGHELSVLKGGEVLFRENSCLLQIETGHGNKCRDDIVLWFQQLGYKHVFSLGPDDYFTNSNHFMDNVLKLKILETAMNLIIDLRWNVDAKF